MNDERLRALEILDAQEGTGPVPILAGDEPAGLLARAKVLEESVPTSPSELADVECSRFDLDFLIAGDGEWQRWQSSIDELSPTDPHLKSLRIELAWHRAAYRVMRGGDWRAELESEYDRDGPFPVRSTIFEAALMYTKRIAWSTVPVAIGVGVATWFLNQA